MPTQSSVWAQKQGDWFCHRSESRLRKAQCIKAIALHTSYQVSAVSVSSSGGNTTLLCTESVGVSTTTPARESVTAGGTVLKPQSNTKFDGNIDFGGCFEALTFNRRVYQDSMPNWLQKVVEDEVSNGFTCSYPLDFVKLPMDSQVDSALPIFLRCLAKAAVGTR